MGKEPKAACSSAGYKTIPNSGDDASYPRDFYSDSFKKGDKRAKAKAIETFLEALGYTREQVAAFCTAGNCPAGKKCKPIGLKNDANDTIVLKLVTMDLGNNVKRKMYWAHAATRGEIKMKASSCECL